VNGFVYHLYTRLGTTTSYRANANLHNSQITTAHTKPFPACCVVTSRSLATAYNSADSSASRAQILSAELPLKQLCLLLITSRHGPHRKHHSPLVALMSVAAGTCLPNRCSETAAAWTTESTVFSLFLACMLWALPSNGRCLQSHRLATGLYATILRH
jgi:hypothetical protein